LGFSFTAALAGRDRGKTTRVTAVTEPASGCQRGCICSPTAAAGILSTHAVEELPRGRCGPAPSPASPIPGAGVRGSGKLPRVAAVTRSGLAWLARTALLAAPRRTRRRETPHWAPAALALGAMVSGFLIVTLSVGLPAVARWIGLGVSIVVFATGVGLALLKIHYRRTVFTAAGWALVLLSAWTIVASAVPFDPQTARWVVLGSGIGYVVEAIVALVAHELSPGRVIHVLEVREGTAVSQARGGTRGTA
jgi:hypothetical protein